MSLITKNYFVEICSFCKHEMILKEGVTIYGDKWYHDTCFNECDQVLKISGSKQANLTDHSQETNPCEIFNVEKSV